MATIFERLGVAEDATAEELQYVIGVPCANILTAIEQRGIRRGLEIAAVVLDNVGTDDVYPSQRMADVMDVCTNIAREIRAKAEEVGK